MFDGHFNSWTVTSLFDMTSWQARDVNLDIKRVVGYRHWCNKLWNAVRFAAGHLPDGYRPNSSAAAPPQLPWACRWILSRLDKAVQQTNQALQLYSFADATTVRSLATMPLQTQDNLTTIAA